MSERGSRRFNAVLMCALWMAVSANAADAWKTPRTAEPVESRPCAFTNGAAATTCGFCFAIRSIDSQSSMPWDD